MRVDNGPAVTPRPGDVAPDLSGHDPSQVVPSDCTPVPVEGDEGGMAEECQGWDWPAGYPTFVQRWTQSCDTSYAEVEEPFLPSLLGELNLRDEVAAGIWVADGTEVVDGRELIRLRLDPDADIPSSSGQTAYVDPDTYLPVEVRGDVGGPDESILRYEYLPRTAANLALLSPPVPAGYTKVDALAPCA
jgi:hypothetical protein